MLSTLPWIPWCFPSRWTAVSGCTPLEAIRTLRDRYGPDIHITGGMSNVSFGIPARKLMNAAFINLAVEAGADSGIIDPVMNPVAAAFSVDRSSEAYGLAEDTLSGP